MSELFQNYVSEEDHMEKMVRKISQLEAELEQQKEMNPISVNMIATISDLSKELKNAREVIKIYSIMCDESLTHDMIGATPTNKRALEFLAKYKEKE